MRRVGEEETSCQKDDSSAEGLGQRSASSNGREKEAKEVREVNQGETSGGTEAGELDEGCPRGGEAGDPAAGVDATVLLGEGLGVIFVRGGGGEEGLPFHGGVGRLQMGRTLAGKGW